MQRNDIYRQVFERFLYTERWVAEEAAGEVEGEEEGDGPDAYLRKTYFFTYLAPEVWETTKGILSELTEFPNI